MIYAFLRCEKYLGKLSELSVRFYTNVTKNEVVIKKNAWDHDSGGVVIRTSQILDFEDDSDEHIINTTILTHIAKLIES